MYILFDIGGTKMRVASSRDGKTFENVKIERTERDNFESAMKIFSELARDVSGGEKIHKAAGGVAGLLDLEKGSLLNAPNIQGWINKPLKKKMSEYLNAPVSLENDASVVGLGEAVHGAGKGHDIVAYITVSTGVGGGRIVDGKIDKTTYGFEPGHHVLSLEDAPQCSGCGRYGDLESLISGTALTKQTGKEPKDIAVDDPVWDEYAKLLAIGLNNVAVFWSPSCIVVGGPMVFKSPGISIDTTKKYFLDTMKIFPKAPEIKQSELKDEGGLYGALALL